MKKIKRHSSVFSVLGAGALSAAVGIVATGCSPEDTDAVGFGLDDNTILQGLSPVVTSINVAKDANNNSIINRTENGNVAGINNVLSNVTVTFSGAAGIEDGQTITLTSSVLGARTATVTNNVATFTDFPFKQGAQTVTVTGTNQANEAITVAGSSRSITVDTAPPSLRIVSPSAALLTATDDADVNTPGLQVDFQLQTTAEDGNIADIRENGVIFGTGTVTGGQATVRATLRDGNRALRAFVKDTAGNATNTALFNTTVDAVGPNIAINSPSENQTFSNADDNDGNIVDGIDITATGSTDAVSGTFTVSCSDGSQSSQSSGNLNIIGGSFTAALADLTLPNCSLTVTGVDANNNPTSDVTNFVVNFVEPVAPVFTFNQPTQNDVLIAGDDADVNAVGFQFTIDLTVANMDNGATVTLTDASRGVLGTCTVSGTSCATTLTLVDGAYAVTATGTSSTNLTATSAARSFTVAATTPFVNSIVIAKDTNVNGVINRLENGNVATSANITSNVTVSFDPSASIEDGRTITLTGSRAGARTATVSSNSATFVNFPLGQGAQTLTVTGTNAAGNAIGVAGSTANITVDTVPPTISIAAPTALTLNTSNDVNLGLAGIQVDFTINTNAEIGQVIELRDARKNPTLLATAVVTGATVVIPNVTLNDGLRQIRAFVKDAAQNASNTAAYSPTVSSAAPNRHVRVNSPVASAQIDVPRLPVQTIRTQNLGDLDNDGINDFAHIDAAARHIDVYLSEGFAGHFVDHNVITIKLDDSIEGNAQDTDALALVELPNISDVSTMNDDMSEITLAIVDGVAGVVHVIRTADLQQAEINLSIDGDNTYAITFTDAADMDAGLNTSFIDIDNDLQSDLLLQFTFDVSKTSVDTRILR